MLRAFRLGSWRKDNPIEAGFRRGEARRNPTVFSSHKNGGFLNYGYPQSSSIYRWMFYYKPSSHWGTPIVRNPRPKIWDGASRIAFWTSYITPLTHRIHVCQIWIYGNIYHEHTPNVSINLPYIRILWVLVYLVDLFRWFSTLNH